MGDFAKRYLNKVYYDNVAQSLLFQAGFGVQILWTWLRTSCPARAGRFLDWLTISFSRRTLLQLSHFDIWAGTMAPCWGSSVYCVQGDVFSCFSPACFLNWNLHVIPIARENFHHFISMGTVWFLNWNYHFMSILMNISGTSHSQTSYRGADKSLARPTSRCILLDG